MKTLLVVLCLCVAGSSSASAADQANETESKKKTDGKARTLDAIHLSICTSREIGQLAAADAVIAAAAADLGIDVVRFS